MAIASTVAATRLGTLLGQGRPANVALTGGFHWAFWVCGAIALLALPVTATLLRRATAPPASTVPCPRPVTRHSNRGSTAETGGRRPPSGGRHARYPGRDRGSPKRDITLASKRVIMLIRSPARVSTISPFACSTGVCRSRS